MILFKFTLQLTVPYHILSKKQTIFVKSDFFYKLAYRSTNQQLRDSLAQAVDEQNITGSPVQDVPKTFYQYH